MSLILLLARHSSGSLRSSGSSVGDDCVASLHATVCTVWCALRLVQVLTTQALDCAAGVVEGCGMDASDSSLTAAAAEIEAAAAAMDDELRTSQQPSAAVDASQDVDMSATSAGESTGVDTVTQVRATGEDASCSNGLCVACLSSHAAWCAACVVRGSASVRVGTGRHSWRHHKGAREAATRAGCGRRGVTLFVCCACTDADTSRRHVWTTQPKLGARC